MECQVVEVMMCWQDERTNWDWGREGWCCSRAVEEGVAYKRSYNNMMWQGGGVDGECYSRSECVQT